MIKSDHKIGSDKIIIAKLTNSVLTKESLNAVITADEVNDDINGKALFNI